MKITVLKIDLFRNQHQFDIAKWAVEAMQDIHQSEDESEVWGRTFDNCPARILDSKYERAVEMHRDVVDDFLYRVETQLPQMSSENPEAPKATRRNCLKLANKVRNAFDLPEITLADIG